MNKFSRTARSVTFAAIVGLSLGVSAPGAFAQTAGVTANQAAKDHSTVTQATGTLTIHKHGGPENKEKVLTGTTADAPKDARINPPLKGAGFTLYKINSVDMTDNASLAKAAGLKTAAFLKPDGSVNKDAGLLGNAITADKLTDEQGVQTFDNLPVGAYLVEETTVPDKHNAGVPFIVFVPMTAGNDNEGGQGVMWNYDVHAYPKNFEKGDHTKTVKDSGKNAGDTVEYTVKATPQRIGKDQTRTVFTIVDQLDTKLDGASKKVVVSDFNSGTLYNENVDYDLVPDDRDQNKVTVKFKDNALAGLSPEKPVKVEITVKVKEDTNGVVDNQAQVYENNPNQKDDLTGKPTPTNKTKTYYGNVEFTKVEAGTTKGLEGADFKVYGVKEGQQCNAQSVVSTESKLDELKFGKESVKIFTSSDKEEGKGKVTIVGLHANDVANETLDSQDKVTHTEANIYKSYCLVEAKAPKNFELLPNPIEFNVNKADAGKTIGLKLTGGQESNTVENLKNTTPKLPLTGGAGVGILAAIGAAIIGAGAWFARRNSAES
ncbi:isopeptide-forming domain-containing fimbrial protein [Corynebacterium diphtheriae]|uniref:SpaH/EbpB family LPXTG-anchored major pilin n=1 Tax=Corynebacterium diphtheriae TaxID=1717 RepID=UPI00095A7C35|nr:SpaH/EbpB family LPXTG-anchored major pilin [Corynebacterium diphtheriae]OLN17437.1 hypothetical protein BUE68_08210 [Corynebacterium diphtheriae]RKW93889.1 isopeptide-forming domain-containing fimbrial protein [Corynebacterium diphtheriae]CAB0583506.1 isopeptide-forming domain-containing fimbrial protein [Corynebacterium diphtheriae]